MKLYPAIDLRGGQAVRLYQGDYDQMTVYNADPAAQARDGAKDDTTANMTTIAAIAKQGGLFIEVGGGIRDEARIEQYLSLGVGRCILGTIAVKDFDFTARMAQKYGPRTGRCFLPPLCRSWRAGDHRHRYFPRRHNAGHQHGPVP